MTYFTRPWKDRVLALGNKYIVSRRPTGVANDGSSAIVLKNKSDTELLLIDKILYKNNNGKAYVDVTKNINIDTSGTSISVEDMRVDETEQASDVLAEYGGSYSGGTTFSLDLISGSKGKFSESSEAESFLMAPGHIMRLTLTNKSGGASDQLLSLILYQKGV